MTAHEWKPGDLAVITEYGTEIPAVMVDGACCESGHVRFGHWHYFAATPDGATWTSKEQPAARPLVVIDPEDREQVERFRAISERWFEQVPYSDMRKPGDLTDLDAMQAALREFANPKPPRPDEPQGLGAVVEDADGTPWVRIENRPNITGQVWASAFSRKRPDRSDSAAWSDIDVVRVLHEGVPS